MKFVNTAKKCLEKNAPEILLGLGVAGIIFATITACKATPEAKETVEIATEELTVLHNEKEHYDPKEYRKDLAKTYVNAGTRLARTYALPVGVGVISLGCIFGSHTILKKRNVALTAAYSTLNEAYKVYRKNVTEKYGAEVDKEMRFGTHKETVEETYIDENGKEKKRKVKKDVVNDIDDLSMYARFFDEASVCFKHNQPEENLRFLKQTEAEANHRLRIQGRLFLNEVYDMLDIPRSKAGQVVGWVYNPDDPNHEGDNIVDFGIFEGIRNARAVNGYEEVFVLDFNVDGNVWENM